MRSSLAESPTHHVARAHFVAFSVFQQIDIEEHVPSGKGPQIRAFGVTQVWGFARQSRVATSGLALTCSARLLQAGHSVLLHITGFLPYFWVAAPKDFTKADCQPLLEHLNVRTLAPVLRTLPDSLLSPTGQPLFRHETCSLDRRAQQALPVGLQG